MAAKIKKATERAEAWRAVFEDMLAAGLSMGAMARELVAGGEITPRGGCWNAKAVSRMLKRLELVPA